MHLNNIQEKFGGPPWRNDQNFIEPVLKERKKERKSIFCCWFIIKVRKAAKVRNRYNQVPRLAQDTTWESDKNTIKHHKQEPRGQPFPSRLPQGSNKQTRKHNKHKTSITQMIHKKKYHLGTVERSKSILLEGLNRLHGPNLTLR